MTHYTTLVLRCRATNSLLADELDAEFRRQEREIENLRVGASDTLEALKMLVAQRSHKAGTIEGALHLWDAAHAAIAKATKA
jgi:hypothetical protein